jgi:hypothetical protein
LPDDSDFLDVSVNARDGPVHPSVVVSSMDSILMESRFATASISGIVIGWPTCTAPGVRARADHAHSEVVRAFRTLVS